MIKKHLKSYTYAFRGIWMAFRHESNMAVHLLAGIVVVSINFFLNVDRSTWLITLMLIGVVWAAEIFNTAVEKLCDRVTKEHDALIGRVKDLAAGAVLILCIIAVACAVIVYYPYLVER